MIDQISKFSKKFKIVWDFWKLLVHHMDWVKSCPNKCTHLDFDGWTQLMTHRFPLENAKCPNELCLGVRPMLKR